LNVVQSVFPLSKRINFTDPTRPTTAFFDYLEIVPTNPLGTRGWRADGGTLTIDSVEGATVRVSADAHMVPEPSFSLQSPATGTFRLRVSIIIDMLGGG
jgi:hypothetical protein